MALVIGLGVRSAKAAYKAYKKHEAEKDLRAKGSNVAMPYEDPEGIPEFRQQRRQRQQQQQTSGVITGPSSYYQYYTDNGDDSVSAPPYQQYQQYPTTTASSSQYTPTIGSATTTTTSLRSRTRSRSPNRSQNQNLNPFHSDTDGKGTTTLNRYHRDTSASSVGSTSTEEIDEAELENDAEFRSFMQRQKQIYLDQRRSFSRSGTTSSQGVGGGSVENVGVGVGSSSASLNARQAPLIPVPSSEPPTYDVAVSQNQTGGAAGIQRRSRVHPVHHLEHPAVAELSDEEAYVVSPVTPVSAGRYSRTSELETGTLSNMGSSVGSVSELPAAPHQSAARYPVEMPATIL